MIYYFSGTGNSKWIAKELASRIGDEIRNIMDLPEEENFEIHKDMSVGFVFPVYAWAPVEVMTKFITKLHIEKGAYLYAIATCGSEVGNSIKKISKCIPLNSGYSISMPSNYILGGDVDSQEVVHNKITNAKEKLDRISKVIMAKGSDFDVTKGSLSVIKSGIVAPLFNKHARTTEAFFADDNCNACGVCQSSCPIKTIKIVEDKPVWGKECLQCLTCINICPKQAIQYGKKTMSKGRYYMKDIQ